MEIKILQVFYGKDGLPYKDKDRQVHFPIAGTGFLGASKTTKIKLYYDELDNLDETTWVAVSKLPNGKLGSKVLENNFDDELNEHYALLELGDYYTQYKGDVFISLQGYQGGVNFDYDEETSQYVIHGTPVIAATGSIKFTINYAPQFIGSGETDNINFQRILAALGTKLGIRAYSEHVEELPSEGSPDVFYVVNDDPNNPNLANIYIWNENTRHYIWVGDNTLDLGEYYTKEEGNAFKTNIETKVDVLENRLNSVLNGGPKGYYATLTDLQTADPNHDYIYLVGSNWYYYDETNEQWTLGGPYFSAPFDDKLNENSENAVQNKVLAPMLNDLIIKSPNLFNKNSNDLLNGYYSSGAFQPNNLYRITHEILLKPGESVKYAQSPSLGSNYEFYYRNEDNSFSGFTNGQNIGGGFVRITNNLTYDLYIRINIGRDTSVPTFMVCYTDDYPSYYMGYGYFKNNVLFNKKIVFDGDSICYGAADSQGGYAWAGRIGDKNAMDWHNVAVSGGTIAVVSGRHNLCTYIETIHQNYPDLDYFFFEGGSNDADVLGEAGLGEIKTFNYQGQTFADFKGPYDTSTFCGAFEHLISKILEYYPHAKIGYIVPPKMGIYVSGLDATILKTNRERYFNKAIDICKKWGLPYCDLYWGHNINPCSSAYYDRTKTGPENIALGHPYSVDAQHPDYIGYDMITPMIEEWIKSL